MFMKTFLNGKDSFLNIIESPPPKFELMFVKTIMNLKESFLNINESFPNLNKFVFKSLHLCVFASICQTLVDYSISDG